MEFIIEICSILLGAGIVIRAAGFPTLAGGYPGPGLFPQVLGVLLILCGLIMVIQRIVSRSWPRRPQFTPIRAEMINAFLTVLAVVFYVVCSDFLGFVPTVFIILAGLMLTLKVRLYSCLALSAALTVAIHLVFYNFLGVPLPTGLLKFLL